jgi:hypothetical protein
VATAEHTYSYLAPSSVREDDGRAEVSLATSGGPALDRHVPLGREAWLATAACLVAKSPDLPRVAADLVVASIEDERARAALEQIAGGVSPASKPAKLARSLHGI